MLNNYEQSSDYKKISLLLIYFTLIAWAYLTYVEYYNIFPKNGYLDILINKVHGSKPNKLILNVIILFLASSAIMTFTPSKVIEQKTKDTSGIVGSCSLFIFIVVGFFQSNFLTLFLHITFFLIGFFSLLKWRRKVAEDLKKDRRHEIESQFDQLREKVETPYSVNIPYKYTYSEIKYISWINIVNPFRAVLVGGTPGSGKSFAVIEEIMRQFTKKGFTGAVYDFKFPTLTIKQYNYSCWYQKNYQITPKFYIVNFDDVEYSNRCNPINRDSLETIADAEENTKVLMLNINRTWIDKEGDFFTDSANVFTAMLMWYLKILVEKYDYDVCSFPHLVALSTFESTEILFLILKEYNDLKPKMKPFSEALEKGALEQLAGQVSSAGVALSKVSSPSLNYILTGDDFSFDLNNPLAPKYLCLGNNPDRQMVYSAPLGLILTKLSKTLNRQKQLPSMFILDEFPTVYVRGIDNLIATARSNKVNTTLGFQSFAQIIADYGKEISDKIIRICGTRIMGQLMDEDAELISKNIGKQKVLNNSFNYSSNEVSENQQTSMEDIVPPERISQFSQGTFCGTVADDFSVKEQNKVFYGEILPPLDLKKREEDIPLPKIYDFTPDNIEELLENYYHNNQRFITKFKEVISSSTIKEWILLIEDLTTERNLNIHLTDNSGFDYNELKTFTKLIAFKKSYLAFINKMIKPEFDLDIYLDNEKIDNFLREAIKTGLINKNKEDFLQKYNDEIYNDVYRIIALEVKDLNILEQIKMNPQLKKTTIPFFKKIISSDKFTDNLIKKEYEEMIDILES